MAEMSNIDHANLENRQIFFHGDIDGYASVAFILSSSLDTKTLFTIHLIVIYDTRSYCIIII